MTKLLSIIRLLIGVLLQPRGAVISSQSIRKRGPAIITPFRLEHVQPSSYDVTLGRHFKVREDFEWVDWEGDRVFIDAGECILATTEETFDVPRDLELRLCGRSSYGRKFLTVHQTAGLIDPGFKGKITLEIKNEFCEPITLEAGTRIGQVEFVLLDEPTDSPYQGRYQGQDTTTESRL